MYEGNVLVSSAQEVCGGPRGWGVWCGTVDDLTLGGEAHDPL